MFICSISWAQKGVVFFDDFSTDKGWTLLDEWERGIATGTPDHDHSGDGYIIGTNIGGNYSSNSSATATSPAIDCTGHNVVILSYWSHSFMENNWDAFYCEVSNDGSTWIDVGAPMYPNESVWTKHTFDISTTAGDQETVYIRFRIDSDGSVEYRGMSIDDVELSYPDPYEFTVDYPTGTAVTAGESHDYTVTINNSGTEDDTYDIEVDSEKGWTYAIYDASGIDIISDLAVDAGESEDFIVRVTVPAGAGMGDEDIQSFTVTSQGDVAISDDFEITTTALAVVTIFPFEEGFEDPWIGDPAAPFGWKQITVSGTNRWEQSSAQANSGTYSALAPWATAGGEHLLITPPLDFLDKDYRLRFFLRGSSSTGTDLKVQIGTDNDEAGDFTIDLAHYVAGTNMPTAWEEQVIDLSAYAGIQFIAYD